MLCALVAGNSALAMDGFVLVPEPVYQSKIGRFFTREEVIAAAQRDASIMSGLTLVKEKVYSDENNKRYALSEIRAASAPNSHVRTFYANNGFTLVKEDVYRDEDGNLYPASHIRDAYKAHNTHVQNAKLLASQQSRNTQKPTDIPLSTIHQKAKKAGRFAAIKCLGALKVMTQGVLLAITGYNMVQTGFRGMDLLQVISKSRDKAAIAYCTAYVALHLTQMMSALYLATDVVPEKFKALYDKFESGPHISCAISNRPVC